MSEAPGRLFGFPDKKHFSVFLSVIGETVHTRHILGEEEQAVS